MIGKLVKGSGARGLAEYLLGPKDHNGQTRDRAEVIGGTFTSQDARGLAREFGAFHALRSTLGVHVAHVSLRVPEGERQLTDYEWRQIGDRWAKGMGFDGFALVSHGDHLHIAASRIKLDGSVVNDSHDWRRSEALIRDIERDFGLARVEASHLLEPEKAVTHRRAPSMAEIALAEKGKAPAAERLRDVVEAALTDKPTVSEFIDRLHHYGVDVRPNLASTGKLNGFAYEIDGQTVTAAAIGRGFTFANLTKRGLDYEPDRDASALRAALARSQARAAERAIEDLERNAPRGLGADRRVADHDDAERRGDSPGVRASGRGDGDLGRGNAADPGADRAALKTDPGADLGGSFQISSTGTAGLEGHADAQSGTGSTNAASGNASTGDQGSAPAQPMAPGAIPAGRSSGGGCGAPPGATVAIETDTPMLDGDGIEAVFVFLRKWGAAMRRRLQQTPSPAVGGGGGGGSSPTDRAQSHDTAAPAITDRSRDPHGGPSNSPGRGGIAPTLGAIGEGRRVTPNAVGGDGRHHGSDLGAGFAAGRESAPSPRPLRRVDTALAKRAAISAAQRIGVVHAQMRGMPDNQAVPAAVARLAALAGKPTTGDRTLDQVRRQITAFGVDRFEVQPIPPKGADHLKVERIRTVTAEQIERSVGWYRRMNAIGYDLYIRPAPREDGRAEPLAFVDDINGQTVERMKAEGLPFAVLVESSAGRYHGWVRIAAEPVAKEELTAAAKVMANRYGGDPNSADWRHFGRISGFTNRKPSRAVNGKPPYAMLRATDGNVAPKGAEVLAEARWRIGQQQAKARREYAQMHHAPTKQRPDDAADAFRIARDRATGDDESGKDFAAAMSMLRRGFPPEQVAAAMLAASPGVTDRHRNVENYVARTVANAADRVDLSTASRFVR